MGMSVAVRAGAAGGVQVFDAAADDAEIPKETDGGEEEDRGEDGAAEGDGADGGVELTAMMAEAEEDGLDQQAVEVIPGDLHEGDGDEEDDEGRRFHQLERVRHPGGQTGRVEEVDHGGKGRERD